ncbi:probable acyl-CoA dehydrogenase 6 [Parasteatoda tepidariorum]|uniref:probable acyl-CoA dehydrogenase 6 n=1 Tax=Parasteatoda tepidariorum TaxID=114398 RepID=UPI00077FD184|nr:probable acyl-CoA dehydrogenase 6 [Parasteatoda tepidariorum]
MSARYLVKLGRCSYCYAKGRQLHEASPHMKNTLTFTEQHDELRQTVKKVIENDVNPYADQWENERCFPIKDVYRKFANAGLLGIMTKIENGGLGLDYSYKVAYIETLKDINCISIPFSILASDIAIEGLSKFGNQEQKKEFLSPSLRGERISCIGIREDSDVNNTAMRTGDDLILNGRIMWVTNGAQADWMLVLANTSKGDPQLSKSLICVPLDIKGISCSKLQLMGTPVCSTSQFLFHNVKVPTKNIIGEEGMGYKYLKGMLQDERLSISVYVFSILERIIEMTADHSKQQDYGPLIDNKIVQYSLAELQTEIEAFRSLVYRTIAQKMKGEDYEVLVSMTKLIGGRLARKVTDDCLQYWGAIGVSDESLIGRFYRDCRPLSTIGGTDELMLRSISKHMCNF